MALRIGEKPLTNAEKQKRFRLRKKDAGLIRREVWTGSDGFLAPATENGLYPTMTLKQLEQGLEKLLAGLEGWEKEAAYAEILEYSKRAIPKFLKVFAEIRKYKQTELI